MSDAPYIDRPLEALTPEQTKQALIEALEQVFGNDNERDPKEMNILIQRVPFLCTAVNDMKDDIKEIRGDIRWVARLVLGTVLLAVLATVLTHMPGIELI